LTVRRLMKSVKNKWRANQLIEIKKPGISRVFCCLKVL
jgi:hypothetical protein